MKDRSAPESGDRVDWSVAWLPEGTWRVTEYATPAGRHQRMMALATFEGMDAAMGWVEARAVRYSLAEGKPLTYVSALDGPLAPSRAQDCLPL